LKSLTTKLIVLPRVYSHTVIQVADIYYKMLNTLDTHFHMPYNTRNNLFLDTPNTNAQPKVAHGYMDEQT